MATLTVAAVKGKLHPLAANRRLIYDADTNDIPSNVGFVVNVDGVLSCRLRRETALADLPVIAGGWYRFDIAQVDITGSTATMVVTVLQNL